MILEVAKWAGLTVAIVAGATGLLVLTVVIAFYIFASAAGFVRRARFRGRLW